MENRWPIEIDGLQLGLPNLNMVIFHGELLKNQMLYIQDLLLCFPHVMVTIMVTLMVCHGMSRATHVQTVLVYSTSWHVTHLRLLTTPSTPSTPTTHAGHQPPRAAMGSRPFHPGDRPTVPMARWLIHGYPIYLRITAERPAAEKILPFQWLTMVNSV